MGGAGMPNSPTATRVRSPANMESVRTRLGLVAGGFSLRTTLPNGASVSGSVHALRARGVVARFDKPGAPTLPLGADLIVQFEGGGLLRAHSTTVRVDAWQDAPDSRAYLFTPQDPETFESVFVEPFHRGDLRRKSARLTPDPENPPTVAAAPTLLDRFVPGRANDLSIDGMQLLVHISHAGALAASDRVCVKITPPGGTAVVAVLGDVRHAHVMMDQFAFGVRFDWDKTPDKMRAESTLTAYVMKLQQRYLAARLERPEDAPV
jgi:hypothetical protein